MDDLIEDVTGRQHDFDNILTGIRMLPYTHTDYSSLKEALISSSDEVISEYRTTELLKINMFVIAGFIYSKQKQAEKAHKKLNIVVHSYLLESRMPEYELVRVLGILIDNALEAISEHDSMTLHLDSRDGRIIITTLNKGPLLTPEIRAKLFTAGYTTKTCDRQKHGLGLYNLRRLVFKYNGKNKKETTAKFVILNLIGLGLNTGILYLLVDMVGFNKLIALVITTGIVMIINYIVNKLWVFKEK